MSFMLELSDSSVVNTSYTCLGLKTLTKFPFTFNRQFIKLCSVAGILFATRNRLLVSNMWT